MRKIKSLDEINLIVKETKQNNKKIVFTNGCFDVVHLGHLKLLKKCKQIGDTVIVGLNSDSSIKKIKGPKRPINNFEYRAEFLSMLSFVDYIVKFDEETPLKLISTILPDVLIKGKGYQKEQIVGSKEVLSNGGEVMVFDFNLDVSTTQILKKL